MTQPLLAFDSRRIGDKHHKQARLKPDMNISHSSNGVAIGAIACTYLRMAVAMTEDTNAVDCKQA